MNSTELFAERYLPVRRLGKGGMGEVWLAQDTLKSNLPVALKFVCSELANDTRAINDLSREVINAQKLTHSNILRVYELMKYKNTCFITMEYVAGEDLNARLGRYQQQGHNFSLEEVLTCARQICPALDYAHDQKVLHLDIKPSNIICDERGNFKLMDFGIARSAHDSMTRVSRPLGYSGGYASPEQVRGRTLNRCTDVYNLSATFYDLLAGKVPCSTEDAIKYEIPGPIYGLPTQINETLLAGLNKDPKERPRSAGMLLVLLEGKKAEIIEPAPLEPSIAPTQQEVQLKTCPKCGSQVKTGTHFCSKCGFMLDKVSPLTAPTVTEPPARPIAKPVVSNLGNSKKGSGAVFIILIIVLIIIAPLVVAVFTTFVGDPLGLKPTFKDWGIDLWGEGTAATAVTTAPPVTTPPVTTPPVTTPPVTPPPATIQGKLSVTMSVKGPNASDPSRSKTNLGNIYKPSLVAVQDAWNVVLAQKADFANCEVKTSTNIDAKGKASATTIIGDKGTPKGLKEAVVKSVEGTNFGAGKPVMLEISYSFINPGPAPAKP